jgi:hypothetical protein
MTAFKIRPRRYIDQLDAIEDVLQNAIAKGVAVDIGKNPNSRYSLLYWAKEEILRLRAKCGEVKPVRLTKLVPGPRPVAESKPLIVSEN